jgi:hypothetical protein
MSRFSGVFWFVLALAAGMTNFMVARTVQGLDDELGGVRRKTVAEQKEIHELNADWTILNQPELLADLNKRYVGLAPMTPKQVIADIDSLPLRLATPPPDVTALIAAATPETPPPPPPPPTTSAPAPIVKVATAPARQAAVQPASLDGLFAQIAGGR